ncbi:hypothetical protein TNCV_3555821 [Trichonephila clavipes]|nr:hypothetical protein TNCV_3555821 [Trichonephila clavipes]
MNKKSGNSNRIETLKTSPHHNSPSPQRHQPHQTGPMFLNRTEVGQNPNGQGTDSWQACHKFESSAAEDPLCRISRWCGVVVRRGGARSAVSLSLDHGSKLRGPLPKAVV